MQKIYLLVPLAPLAGALLSGLLCRKISNRVAHSLTILLMLVSFAGAVAVFRDVLDGNHFNGALYTWLESESAHFEVGFLIDQLSATMMLVVTFVSLMVHIYTIGYMHGDPGYNRFFSYISLFTFSMLMLVSQITFSSCFSAGKLWV